MKGKFGRRALVGVLAFFMAFAGLVPGGTQQALALIVADRITHDRYLRRGRRSHPGPPASPTDPSTNTLIVVDGERTRARPTANLWEYSLTTGQVVYSAAIDVNGDATGVSWDSANDVLFVSSDSSPQGI